MAANWLIYLFNFANSWQGHRNSVSQLLRARPNPTTPRPDHNTGNSVPYKYAKMPGLKVGFTFVYGTSIVPINLMLTIFLTLGKHRLVKVPTQISYFYDKSRGCARSPTSGGNIAKCIKFHYTCTRCGPSCTSYR